MYNHINLLLLHHYQKKKIADHRNTSKGRVFLQQTRGTVIFHSDFVTINEKESFNLDIFIRYKLLSYYTTCLHSLELVEVSEFLLLLHLTLVYPLNAVFSHIAPHVFITNWAKRIPTSLTFLCLFDIDFPHIDSFAYFERLDTSCPQGVSCGLCTISTWHLM